MKIFAFSLVLVTYVIFPQQTLGIQQEYLSRMESYDHTDHLRKKNCLAQNIYHEARGESETGMIGVAFATMNRVHSTKYPNDVCDVVFQAKKDKRGKPIKHKCQFSWYCDGKSDEITDEEEFQTAKNIASYILHMHEYVEDPTSGATMYHSARITPYWADAFEKTTQIENHIFYR
jgi:N-acetylmuramoyl-L-alanine amidase